MYCKEYNTFAFSCVYSINITWTCMFTWKEYRYWTLSYTPIYIQDDFISEHITFQTFFPKSYFKCLWMFLHKTLYAMIWNVNRCVSYRIIPDTVKSGVLIKVELMNSKHIKTAHICLIDWTIQYKRSIHFIQPSSFYLPHNSEI